MKRLSNYREQLDVNHVVIVTTNTHERVAITRMLSSYVKLETGNPSLRAYLGCVGDNFVVLLDGAGGYTNANSSARFTASYLSNNSYPNPRLVILGGICWGNPSQVDLGDVVVSSSVTSLNRVVVKPGERQEVASNQDCPVDLETLIRALPLPVRVGPILSLEARFEDEIERDRLLAEYPQALGGEMEAFSIVPECATTHWLVVKAVSDHGAAGDSRESQPGAAASAARVISAIVNASGEMHSLDDDEGKSESHKLLLQAIHGKEISIPLNNIESKSVNQYVSAYFKRIEYAAEVHTRALGLHARLPFDISRIASEIVSNSFRHGRARGVKILFSPSMIRIQDDGTEFNPENLRSHANGRGGRLAITAFWRNYIDSSVASIVSRFNGQGNIITITISDGGPDTTGIPLACRAFIGESSGRPRNKLLTWGDDCDLIYIDFDKVGMFSYVLDICEELVAPIADGKRFIIRCTDEDTISEVGQRYPEAISKLQIIFIPPP